MKSFGAIGIAKEFSGVRVLHGVDFTMEAGEVHALLGENGSGKSTLVKILSGALAPAAGHVHVDGEAVSFGSPLAAQRAGLAVVYQDHQLFPDLDVAMNVVGVTARDQRRSVLVSRRRTRDHARAILVQLGITLDAGRAVRGLRPADWKLLEIARALALGPSFLILDEPTASLDRRDSRRVLDLIRRLTSQGVGVAFVTHRLDEALEASDRVTVLRDGRLVAQRAAGDLTLATLARLIVGPALLEDAAPARARERPEVALELAGVRLREGAAPWDLRISAGEVLGLTGLAGSGAMEVARMIAGDRAVPGRLIVGRRERVFRSPRAAKQAGIGYIPEDRQGLGLVRDMSVELNLALAGLPRICRNGFVSRRRMRSQAEGYASSLRIRAPSLQSPVRTLSGGNQQKVLIARWLASDCRILVIETPTHGVDVGAKGEIFRLLRDFAARGGAVIVASSDVPEVLAIADRVAVFNRGELVEVLRTSDSSYGDILVEGSRNPELQRIADRIELSSDEMRVEEGSRSGG